VTGLEKTKAKYLSGSVLNFMYEMKREGGDSKILPYGNEYHEEDEI
jgi:hypothetical protein